MISIVLFFRRTYATSAMVSSTVLLTLLLIKVFVRLKYAGIDLLFLRRLPITL